MNQTFQLVISFRPSDQHGVSLEYLTVHEQFASRPTQAEAESRATQVLANKGKATASLVTVTISEILE